MRCSTKVILPLSLLFALTSCSGSKSVKDLAGDWVDGVKKMQTVSEEHGVLFDYFQEKWNTVSWEVLSERKLRDHLSGRNLQFSISTMFDFFKDVEREAKQVFYRRYGFDPPEYFPPVQLDIVAGVTIANNIMIANRWEEIFKHAGLTGPKDIPGYLERWRNRFAKLEAEEERIREVDQKYKLIFWRTRAIVEVAEDLRVFKDQLKAGSKSQQSTYLGSGEFLHDRWLGLMQYRGMIEAKVEAKNDRSEVEWRLATGREETLRKMPLDELAILILWNGSRPEDIDHVPLILGKYYYIAEVLEAKWEKSPEFDEDNPTGFNTGQKLRVQIIDSMDPANATPFGTPQEIFSYGGIVSIKGKPGEKDLVGFRKEGDSQIWEKLAGDEVNLWQSRNERLKKKIVSMLKGNKTSKHSSTGK